MESGQDQKGQEKERKGKVKGEVEEEKEKEEEDHIFYLGLIRHRDKRHTKTHLMNWPDTEWRSNHFTPIFSIGQASQQNSCFTQL